MKLLVDIGNWRVKWALVAGAGDFDGARGVVGGAIAMAGDAPAVELAAAWAGLAPAGVWVSCVGAPARRRAVAEYARAAWSLDANFIAAQPRQCGVVNGYRDPSALGSDRWAALIAARALRPRRAVIVIDAGTAVTVDLLERDGRFRGGVILPGARAMQAALAAHTADLRFDTDRNADANGDALATDAADATDGDALATDTASAMAHGAWLAVAGGIDQAVARQRRAVGGDCDALATGGDAARIVPLLADVDAGADAGAVEIAPHLVLRGLAVIADAEARR